MSQTIDDKVKHVLVREDTEDVPFLAVASCGFVGERIRSRSEITAM
jgi:hypothetical protein